MTHKLPWFLLIVLAILAHPTRGEETASLVLAVSDFTGDNPASCQAVTEIVLTDLAKSRRLTLVERAQLRQALSELRLQRTGLTESGDMARAGRLIGATHVVIGSLSVNEQRVILNARVLDVRTGALYAGAAVNVEGWSDELFTLAHELANSLHHQLTGEGLPDFVAPPATAALREEVSSSVGVSVSQPAASPAPGWENLPESEAIALALAKGWMRLFADHSFRPYEPVSDRYFLETLRRLARRYQMDDSRYFTLGEGTGTVSRIQAARIAGALVAGRAGYFLEVPDWAVSWLSHTPHKPLTRAQFAVLLQRMDEQIQRKITSAAAASSVSAGER